MIVTNTVNSDQLTGKKIKDTNLPIYNLML